ncbi:hypothetical protein MPER_13201 [Moniliophthora perniciosa FA553]|nr:hypothetical protein MPER_13201 [Moniliophthora perniciosa FA553]
MEHGNCASPGSSEPKDSAITLGQQEPPIDDSSASTSTVVCSVKMHIHHWLTSTQVTDPIIHTNTSPSAALLFGSGLHATLLDMNGETVRTSLGGNDTQDSPISSRSSSPSISASQSRVSKASRYTDWWKVYREVVLSGVRAWRLPRYDVTDQPSEIARLHQLKDQLPTIGAIHKRFDEKLTAIVARAEELAAETGCYLFFSASVPTRGTEVVHFASKRLRKEAPTALDKMYNLNVETFQALVNARRKDVLQAEMEVARARAAAQMAQASEASLRADIESLTRANTENQVLIDHLRAILGPNALALLTQNGKPQHV